MSLALPDREPQAALADLYSAAMVSLADRYCSLDIDWAMAWVPRVRPTASANTLQRRLFIGMSVSLSQYGFGAAGLLRARRAQLRALARIAGESRCEPRTSGYRGG